MRSSLPRLAEIIRHQLWLTPMVAAIIAAAAAIVVVAIEDQDTVVLPFQIDPLGAQGVLSAISSAMISFTALVFSVTMLVLQQASQQLSPRVTRTFLRDRFNQAVLGLFVATFVFSLIVLVTMSADRVPQLGLAISFLLVLAAVLAFVVYLDHVANAIRASTVIEAISNETTEVIARIEDRDDADAVPDDGTRHGPGLPEVTAIIRSPHRSGYVVSIDEGALAKAAAAADCVVEMLVAPGDFIVEGEPLLAVHGGSGEAGAATEAIEVASDRSMSQDPLFGFRQLVDIALRALSPSTNDPATAVQVVERIHVLLRKLLTLPVASPLLIHDGGALRAVVPSPDWDAYVSAAVDEIDEARGDLTQVREALRAMLAALAADAEADRLPALRRAATRLDDPDGGAPA